MTEPETIQESKFTYSKQRVIEMICDKMDEKEALNTSDQEIERCLSGCVAANKLISLAKIYRSEIILTSRGQQLRLF